MRRLKQSNILVNTKAQELKATQQNPTLKRHCHFDVTFSEKQFLSKITTKNQKLDHNCIQNQNVIKEKPKRMNSPEMIQITNRLKKIEDFDKKIEQKLFKIRSQKTLKTLNQKSQTDKTYLSSSKKSICIEPIKKIKNVQSQPTPPKQQELFQEYYKNNDRHSHKTQKQSQQKKYPKIIKIKKLSLNLCNEFSNLDNQNQNLPQYSFQILHAYQTRKRSSDEGDSTVNQDSYVIKRNLGKNENIQLFGVFDGHGKHGHLVSNYLKLNLPNQITSKQNLELDRHKLIKNSFNRMLVKLYETNQKQLQVSGSTAICCLIENSTLYVSNIGDSRAIMGCQPYEGMCWQYRELSSDHVPSMQKQASRVLKNGGLIRKATMNGEVQTGLRVWAKNSEGKSYGIRMTRSFGDSCLSSVGVISIPQIKQYKLSKSDKIIVIGSDGLYQKMSNFQIIEFISPYYQRKKSPQQAGQNLMKHLKTRMLVQDGYEDDVTFIILFLNKC